MFCRVEPKNSKTAQRLYPCPSFVPISSAGAMPLEYSQFSPKWTPLLKLLYFCCVNNIMLEDCFLVCRIYSDSRWKYSVIYNLVVFTSYLRGDCEKKKHNAVIPTKYRLVSGPRASLVTVPPPRDRLSSGRQSELISWCLSPTISMVPVTPLYRHVTNA